MLNSTRRDCLESAAAITRTSSGVMCRRSARGCTVMPGAPAAIQTSTASSTLGTLPPREFLSVATLLTFTERRIIANGEFDHLVIWLSDHFKSIQINNQVTRRSDAQIVLYNVHDFLGPRADLAILSSLEHDAEQGLGA